jgi:hypothetical protein
MIQHFFKSSALGLACLLGIVATVNSATAGSPQSPAASATTAGSDRNPLAPYTRTGDGLWIWGNLDVLGDLEQQDELFSFIEANDISEVYIAAHLGEGVDDLFAVDGPQADDHFPNWQRLIKRCHAAGLTVEALVGDTDWLMPSGGWEAEKNKSIRHRSGREQAIKVARSVYNYNRSVTDPAARFDGLQFDVEINWFDDGNLYTPEGRRMTPKVQTEYFLELIDQVAAARTAAGLSKEDIYISWVIYSDMDAPRFCGIDVLWPKENGTVKLGWKHALDRMEKILFMTYFDHDRADQLRTVIGEMQAELSYLDAMEDAPPVRYAFEFQRKFRVHNLLRISLWNEDKLTLANQKQVYSAQFINRPYFEGFAMHCYDNQNLDYGDYRTWLGKHREETYPQSMKSEGEAPPVSLPADRALLGTHENPFFLRLNIKADPAFSHSGSDQDPRNMIALLPVGPGYAGESDLATLGDSYDGVAPMRWNDYLKLNAWWDSAAIRPADLIERGLAWPNPASEEAPDQAVARDLVLIPGEAYRFLVFYNDPRGISSAFHSFALEVPAPDQGWGDSADAPAQIDVYLGQTLNLDQPREPHLIQSFVIAQPAQASATEAPAAPEAEIVPLF